MVKHMTPISSLTGPAQTTTYFQALRRGLLVGPDGNPGCDLPDPRFLTCPHCGAATDVLGISLNGGASWKWVCATGHACPVLAERSSADMARSAETALEQAMDAAGIPPEHRVLGAGDFPDGSPLRNYLLDVRYREEGGGAYIYSKAAGTGKTTAAHAIAAECVRSGRSSVVVTEPVLVARMRTAMDREGESVLDVLAGPIGARCLVLDDLGKSSPSDWLLSQLFIIVDERAKKRRPTVYTAQYSLDALERRWSAANPTTAEAIISRIQGSTIPIEMAGPDLRRAR